MTRSEGVEARSGFCRRVNFGCGPAGFEVPSFPWKGMEAMYGRDARKHH